MNIYLSREGAHDNVCIEVTHEETVGTLREKARLALDMAEGSCVELWFSGKALDKDHILVADTGIAAEAVVTVNAFLDPLRGWDSAPLDWITVTIPHDGSLNAAPVGGNALAVYPEAGEASEVWLVTADGATRNIPIPLPESAKITDWGFASPRLFLVVVQEFSKYAVHRYLLGKEGFEATGAKEYCTYRDLSKTVAVGDETLSLRYERDAQYRCGKHLRYNCNWTRNTLHYTVYEGQDPVGSFEVSGHPNHEAAALGATHMLVSGENAGEDAFYGDMRLVDWRSGEVVRTIPLGAGLSYIECECPRGMIADGHTFYTLMGPRVVLATPRKPL